MTRISVGIKASELCDQHLRKERIEILRIPNAIKSGKAVIKDIPTKFSLGEGHVKFFYDKLLYLHKRYDALTTECINRGFVTTDYSSAFRGLPNKLYNDYTETLYDRKIVGERIKERLTNMKDIKYRSEPINIENLFIGDLRHLNSNR
jgi:deoxyribonuclease (pyrimidine dimer)